MNSLYEKDNLLPYVTEEKVPAPPKPSIFKPKLNKNTLSTLAFIMALLSLVFGFLLVPSILGIALGTGALIVAVKRGLPKKLPIISMAVSTGTLILSVIGLVFVINAFAPPADPYIPSGYTYHERTAGIAYKYNPLSNIPCDAAGKCTFEVQLLPIESECYNGGTFTPDMADLGSGMTLPAEPVSFPALTEGEVHSFTVTLIGPPNGRLNEASSYPIMCTP